MNTKWFSIKNKLAGLIAGIFWPAYLALAQETNSLVPCTDDCNLESLIQLFKNLVNWLIMIAVPVAAIAIAYAGWLFIWGGTNPGSRGKANTILWSAVIGLGVVLAASLIVKAILTALANPPYSQLIP